MGRMRINTDTGIVEQQNDWIDDLTNVWHESRNENGNSERINTDTGVVEESGGLDRWLGIWNDKQ